MRCQESVLIGEPDRNPAFELRRALLLAASDMDQAAPRRVLA